MRIAYPSHAIRQDAAGPPRSGEGGGGGEGRYRWGPGYLKKKSNVRPDRVTPFRGNLLDTTPRFRVLCRCRIDSLEWLCLVQDPAVLRWLAAPALSEPDHVTC